METIKDLDDCYKPGIFQDLLPDHLFFGENPKFFTFFWKLGDGNERRVIYNQVLMGYKSYVLQTFSFLVKVRFCLLEGG
jgi:hypothetical protein